VWDSLWSVFLAYGVVKDGQLTQISGFEDHKLETLVSIISSQMLHNQWELEVSFCLTSSRRLIEYDIAPSSGAVVSMDLCL
jgi:uncharacterized protein YaaQ